MQGTQTYIQHNILNLYLANQFRHLPPEQEESRIHLNQHYFQPLVNNIQSYWTFKNPIYSIPTKMIYLSLLIIEISATVTMSLKQGWH